MKLFRDLPVKLSDAEWAANSSALAAEQQKLIEAEGEKATVMQGYKSRIESHKERMLDLGRKVHSHEETRAVECFERHDAKKFIVEVYRADSGELVETRPMSAAERHEAIQVTLPGVSRTPPTEEN